jgi:hypothetical protein
MTSARAKLVGVVTALLGAVVGGDAAGVVNVDKMLADAPLLAVGLAYVELRFMPWAAPIRTCMRQLGNEDAHEDLLAQPKKKRAKTGPVGIVKGEAT